jgi:hypothetical protein
MTWLAWRQFRVQAITAAAVLAAFAVLLGATGPHLASLYDASGIGSCQGGGKGSGCQVIASTFLSQLYSGGTYWVLYLVSVVIILIAPAMIGIFWGAPLVAREFETGTRHLAWNQSITRARWLAVKLALAGLAAIAVTEGLSLMQAWWAAPIGRAVGRGGNGTLIALGKFSPVVFATHGITPLGYAAFAFALGVAAGLLIRRAVPAMAVTLAIFAVVQVAMPLAIRPHLFPPQHATIALAAAHDISFSSNGQGTVFSFGAGDLPGQPGAWILASGPVNAAGQPVSTVPAGCQSAVANSRIPAALTCLSSHGIEVAVTYQPASRYWAFEWTETAIFLVLALALGGFCFWQLSRRRT